MPEPLKLLCVFAHPDDESLGCAFLLAYYAAQGVETYLVTATRGERGWNGDEKDFPGLAELGRIREQELLKAARVLGIREVGFLDYIDGDLDQAPVQEAVAKITHAIRRVRPQVVLTFDPFGAYGHPDHIAISQFTQAAVVTAADASFTDLDGCPPHRVSKLYYMADSLPLVKMVAEVWEEIGMTIDGVRRTHTGWPDWALTTRVDASAFWETGLEAIACHETQVSEVLPGLRRLPQTHDPRTWTVQTFYRAFSLVNGGRTPETDLFEGLRSQPGGN